MQRLPMFKAVCLCGLSLAGASLACAAGSELSLAGASLACAAGSEDKLSDSRLGKPKDYNGYFPMTVPADLKEWEVRKQLVREQVLVANGLWPMPEKLPLKPVIHGKIQREGYTIEKVFFASYPGHYVCGNLYRPTGKTGKLPAILSPHGHWANGRFFEASDKEAANQIKQKAETTRDGAKYPLQARCAQLARMGCVVFHYDMVGVADSLPIGHRQGFLDVQAELRLQNFMGLQTYNSIRALDFLLSLPDVDPQRIGMTGASGGGTQTFILCAIDDRPAAAFPAVMVSTAMQGGCICENCSYLRIGTGNIELAALFAPKPLGMSAARDWTQDIEKKGLPELKALYRLYGVENNVMAETHLEFGHNYNQVSREIMYNFFNKHLKLGQPEPISEKAFLPVPPKELSVFDAEHPRPADAADAVTLKKTLTEASDRQLAGLMPRDAKSLAEFRKVLGPALRAMITEPASRKGQIEVRGKSTKEAKDGLEIQRFVLSRRGAGEAVPVLQVQGKETDGRIVLWVHPGGLASLWEGGKLVPAAQKMIDAKATIVAVEVLRTGASAAMKPAEVNKSFSGYTFGYNRPLLAERVRDILTATEFALGITTAADMPQAVNMIGFGKAGPWVVLASALCNGDVGRTVADLNQFNFADVTSFDDEMMLPGALKYGGLMPFAALCAPQELYLYNVAKSGSSDWVMRAYESAGQRGRVRIDGDRPQNEAAVAWLLRK